MVQLFHFLFFLFSIPENWKLLFDNFLIIAKITSLANEKQIHCGWNRWSNRNWIWLTKSNYIIEKDKDCFFSDKKKRNARKFNKNKKSSNGARKNKSARQSECQKATMNTLNEKNKTKWKITIIQIIAKYFKIVIMRSNTIVMRTVAHFNFQICSNHFQLSVPSIFTYKVKLLPFSFGQSDDHLSYLSEFPFFSYFVLFFRTIIISNGYESHSKNDKDTRSA